MQIKGIHSFFIFQKIFQHSIKQTMFLQAQGDSKYLLEWMIDLIHSRVMPPVDRSTIHVSLTDAFSGIGKNTLAFAQHDQVSHVKAIEFHEHRCRVLECHVAMYLDEKDRKKVCVFEMDFLEWCRQQEQEQFSCREKSGAFKCLFVDSAWGDGIHYKKEMEMEMKTMEELHITGQVSLRQMCEQYPYVFSQTMVVFKFPVCLQVDSFCHWLRQHEKGNVYLYRMKKMILVAVVNKRLST